MTSMSDKELYEFAKKKVESRRGFIIHLGIYLIFSVIFISTSLTNGFKAQYMVPVLGWGIGVIFHAISFNLGFRFNLENVIEKEFNKLKDNYL